MRIRSALLAGSSFAMFSILVPASAIGQVAPQAPAQVENAREQASSDGLIVVTGTRIQQKNLTSESPFVSLGAQDLQNQAPVLVTDVLRELPQLGATFGVTNQGLGEANRGFNTGTNLANLRNLGTGRTLVLVNGRRFVGGDPGTSSVDLTMIPTAFIERVDVVTGAATAVYGGDAVSGVINLIYRQDFEGVELQARSGLTSKRDAREVSLSGAFGGAFAEGRGHVLVGAEYTNQQGFFQRNRFYGQFDAENFTIRPDNGSIAIPGGRLNNGANGVFGYNPITNALVPINSLSVEQRLYNRAPSRHQEQPVERFLVSAAARYDFLDGPITLTGYTEATVGKTKALFTYEPLAGLFRGNFGTILDAPFEFPTIPRDNPFLQTVLPIIGNVPDSGLIMFRRFTEAGDRAIRTERDTLRFVTGIRGDLSNKVRYDIYYQYGQVNLVQSDTGVIDRTKLVAALDVDDAGTPGNFSDDFCRSAFERSRGCVPVNLFGPT